MQDVTLVFDIGKTNKKVLVFDASLQITDEQQVHIPMVDGDDGLVYDDIPAVVRWMEQQLQRLGTQRGQRIRAINVTTFGATIAHLDAAGELAHPVFSYTNEIDAALEAEYHSRMQALPGGFARYATPPAGMLLTIGKQLYWISRQWPALQRRIATSLFLPQYFIYKLTGKRISEPTYFGCHTGLWDFEQMRASEAALDLAGWGGKLPPVTRDSQTFSLVPALAAQVDDSKNVRVGAGLHDSSSALIPFSQALQHNFVLVSTGTWIVCLNPDAEFYLSESDLQQDRLYYLTPQCKAVRAARLFAGQEHDVQLQAITAHFGRPPATHSVAIDTFLPGFFGEENERTLLPAVLKGSGPFPRAATGTWDVGAFASPEQAYARLCLDLAVLTSYCIDSVHSKGSEKIVVDGGFARNEWFLNLLARLHVPKKVYSTDVPQATALGAALAIHDKPVDTGSLVSLQECRVEPLSGLHIYAERFISRLQGDA